MAPVSAVTCAGIFSWGSSFSSLCTWELHQWPACNSLLQQRLNHLCLMSTIILSMAHHIYEPNYLKFPVSESCSKEGKLKHPLFGFFFFFKSHQDSGYKVGILLCLCLLRSCISCLWTNNSAKEEQLLWNNSLFFLFRHSSCNVTGTGVV